MSKLKYKVGDKAGPFKVVDLDYTDPELPFRLRCNDEGFWISEKDADTIFDHYAKSELLEKKAESQRKTIAYWKGKFERHSKIWETSYQKLSLDLETTNKNYLILKNENKELKESNVELLERCRISESGIASLEADAKANRIQIGLLKNDFEFEQKERIHVCQEFELLKEDYNELENSRKHRTVLALVGWVLIFMGIFGLIFFKGES